MATSVPRRDASKQIAEVARRFYLGDESKVSIAESLGVSRFKVARMLEEARSLGIVKIEVAESPGLVEERAQALANHLHLEHVVLVPGSKDIYLERNDLGRAGAQFLSGVLRPDDKVGVSWGRTLLPVGENLRDLASTTFIQIAGVVGNDPAASPIEIISRIPRASGLKAMALIAPLFAASAEMAEAFREEPAVADVLATYSTLDAAILSIGSWNPRVTQLADLFDEQTCREIDEAGAVADMAGMFLSASGRYLDLRINDRRISISVDELAGVRTVVALAGGKEKVGAIHAVASSGLITSLVTTTQVCEHLLRMPSVKGTVFPRK